VQEQPHKRFKRKGADLLIEHKITLHEALTGVDFVITHLDGAKIRIKNAPGEVIKPDDLKTVPDKGLPFHKKSFTFGNLFVMFKVVFPDSIPVSQIASLKQALPGPTNETDDSEMADAETIMLQNFSEG
jgi:DnaJ family protein A protein 2